MMKSKNLGDRPDIPSAARTAVRVWSVVSVISILLIGHALDLSLLQMFFFVVVAGVLEGLAYRLWIHRSRRR